MLSIDRNASLLCCLTAWVHLSWHQTPETASGVVAFTTWGAQIKMHKYIYWCIFATCRNIHILPGTYCLSPMHCFINLAQNKLNFWYLNLRLTQQFDFNRNRGQRCRWLLGTKHWVRIHVSDVSLVWRTTNNNTKPNTIWIPRFFKVLNDTKPLLEPKLISADLYCDIHSHENSFSGNMSDIHLLEIWIILMCQQ